MSLDTERVTIKRYTRTSDGAGGKNRTLVTVTANVECTFSYPAKRADFRTEQANGSQATGPGESNLREGRFFIDKSDQPSKQLPTVKADYFIIRANGDQWKVVGRPRTYDENGDDAQMQLEVELQ